ncbi:MAG: hypothetical protein Q7S20_02880 [Gemmatimonadaceae bacterium]|nr:hypothetical protein [Gemmatimonadaceae bacterium]
MTAPQPESESPEFTKFELESLHLMSANSGDWFLQDLVALANKGITLSVTLSLGGSMVSGQIIGGREYFTLLGEAVGAAMGLSEDEARNMFAGYRDIYPEATKHEEDDEEQDDDDNRDKETGERERGQRPAAFIHLKNARTYFGTSQVPQRYEGILWRGRISEVAGYTFGEMRTEQQ